MKDVKRDRKIVLLIISILIVSVSLIFYNLNLKNKKENDEIILGTNNGVPYEWSCKVMDESIVEINKKYTKDLSKKYMVGGEKEIHYVLKGIKKGNTKIECYYKNFVYNEIDKTYEYNVVVDNDLYVQVN